ncbi:MAG: hypothetical protein ACK5YK_01510 [Pseudomonadota bacterium]|jgi:hypothetical protein
MKLPMNFSPHGAAIACGLGASVIEIDVGPGAGGVLEVHASATSVGGRCVVFS